MKLVNIFIRNASAVSFEFLEPNDAWAMVKVLREGKFDFTGYVTLPHPCGEANLKYAEIVGWSVMDFEKLGEEGIKSSLVKHRISRDHERRLEADFDKEQDLLKSPVGVTS
jgi:hypothetical protein